MHDQRPSEFLTGPTPLAFAHRGFVSDTSAAGTENTMAAFEAAVALGFRYLETDIRVTADGVALAFHDATLDRVTDRRGRIDALPWATVRGARVAGAQPIPLLADLLAAWPDVRVNLDIKSERGVRATIDAIRRTGTVRRVCIAAFSTRRVHAVRRELGPGLCTSLGPREAMRLQLPSSLHGGGTVRDRCAQVPARIGRRAFVDARYLAAAHARGLQVHAWTVNDEAEMTRLLDLGVDGIITDRADLLRDVLVRRGQWTPRPA